MALRILKSFILVLIIAMIIPIYLYNDNVAKDQAIVKKDFKICEEINYKFLYQQCLSLVQEQKALSCDNFPDGEVKDNCIASTIQQKGEVKRFAEMKTKYTLMNYRPIYFSVIAMILFIFLIKGSWIKRFPTYERILQQVTEVLPESDYFSKQGFWLMSFVIFIMGVTMIIVFEILALLYS